MKSVALLGTLQLQQQVEEEEERAAKQDDGSATKHQARRRALCSASHAGRGQLQRGARVQQEVRPSVASSARGPCGSVCAGSVRALCLGACCVARLVKPAAVGHTYS